MATRDERYSHGELKSFLEKQPSELKWVVIARMTLRLLPLVQRIWSLDENEKSELVKNAFRASFLYWTNCNIWSSELEKYVKSGTSEYYKSISRMTSKALNADNRDIAFIGNFVNQLDNYVIRQDDLSDVASFGYGQVISILDVAAADEFWSSLSADTNHIVVNIQPGNVNELRDFLASKPLWLTNSTEKINPPDEIPDWAISEWMSLRDELQNRSFHHQVWIDWYDAVLNGNHIFSLSPQAEEKLILKLATQPNKFWEQDFEKISEEFSSWVNEAQAADKVSDADAGNLESSNNHSENDINIPAIQPATIEPEWLDGKLVLPKDPLDDDLENASISAALVALKSDIAEFGAALNEETNIDPRILRYFERLETAVPTTPPAQDVLFSLAHRESFFQSYGNTVSDEWSQSLAAQFHALGLQFSRVMKQFPQWRAFKANAEDQPLVAGEIERVENLAKAMEQALRENLALDIADKQIVDQLAAMTAQLAPQDGQSIDEFLQISNDLLAVDVLDSVDNIIKRVVEGVLFALGHSVRFIKYSGKHFGTGLKKEYESQLDKSGKGVVKWGKRLLVGTAVTGAASLPLGQWLLANYPQTFSWLEPILKLFV